jgi:hypothetical protein
MCFERDVDVCGGGGGPQKTRTMARVGTTAAALAPKPTCMPFRLTTSASRFVPTLSTVCPCACVFLRVSVCVYGQLFVPSL